MQTARHGACWVLPWQHRRSELGSSSVLHGGKGLEKAVSSQHHEVGGACCRLSLEEGAALSSSGGPGAAWTGPWREEEPRGSFLPGVCHITEREPPRVQETTCPQLSLLHWTSTPLSQ